jgi:REP element-mobilizing transposase RayT
MARKPRKEFRGAWHHLMNRGARREAIFRDNRDRYMFLDTLEDTIDRFGIELHVFSLMPTHYHLFSRSLLGNISSAMQYLNSTYTLKYNTRHGLDGPIFRGRFTNQIVSNRRYQKYLVAYIHLNPIRANLARKLSDRCWTSHRAYIGLDPTPPWLITEYLLKLFGGAQSLNQFISDVHMGLYEPPQEFSEDGWIMESGSIIVDPSLNERDSIIMPVHELPAIRKPETRKPKEVLVEVCKLTGLNLKEILTSRRGKGANPARRFAVWALHQSTTCTQKEIAGTLEMPFSQVTSLLSRFRHREQSVTIRKWMETWHDSE